MAFAGRYSRDREGNRRAILHAARELFAADGYRNVSIRRIAERIEYSPAAIYLYFPSKADIFFALAEDGFRRFGHLLASPGPDEDPLLALEGRFWRYYEFSKRHPDYFWLMFVDPAVPRRGPAWERLPLLEEVHAEGMELVRRSVAAGLLPAGTDAGAACQALSTAIHGAAVSRLGRRPIARDEADLAARNALRAVIGGLRAGVALERPAAPARPRRRRG